MSSKPPASKASDARRSPSPSPRPSTAISEEGSAALSHLATAAHADKTLTDGIENLIQKERKLAELGILLTLSAHGGGGAGGGGEGILARSTQAPKYTHQSSKDVGMSAPWEQPSRIPASAFASPHLHLPSGMLRPASGRAEVSQDEAGLLAGLLPSAKCGLDLSHMPLGDDAGGQAALELLGRAVSSAGATTPSRAPTPTPAAATSTSAALKTSSSSSSSSSSAPAFPGIRALDLRGCGMGPGGAIATLGLVGQFSRGLSAVSLEGNTFGGGAGGGSLVDALSKAGNMVHLGVTVNDVPFSSLPALLQAPEPPWPPLPPVSSRLAPGVKAPAATKAKPASAAATKGGAAAATPAMNSDVKASSAYLVKALKGNGTPATISPIVSLSLAQSTLTRASLGLFLSSWVPPQPHAPEGHHAAAHGPAGKAAPAKKPTGAAAAAAAKPGATQSKPGGVASSTPPPPPHLMALSLASTHVGSLAALDIAMALGPPHFLLDPKDPRDGHKCGLGGVDLHSVPPGLLSPPGDAAKKAPAKAPAGKGAVAHPATSSFSLFQPHLHGSLYFVRVLDLSNCSLSTQGLNPVLEAVAFHCSYLSHLSLHGNAIDDIGAQYLSHALLHNAARVGDEIKGKVRGGEEEGGSAGGHPPTPSKTAPLLQAAGMTTAHITPIRVLDITGNPLSLSGDGVSRPGCTSLVQAFNAHLPELLTLTGPMPSPLGIVGMKAGCTAAGAATSLWSPASGSGGGKGEEGESVGGVRITSPTLMGWGDMYPIDLAAIQAAAIAAGQGGAGCGAPPPVHNSSAAHRLALPGGISHKAVTITQRKLQVVGLKAGGSGGKEGVEQEAEVMWDLSRPALTASVTKALTGVALALAPPPQPSPCRTPPFPRLLGVCCLEAMVVPQGEGGHLRCDWPEGNGKWHIAQPQAFLEWRGTVCGGSAECFALAAPFLELNWGVIMSGSMGGLEGGFHLATLPSSCGSTDRILARKMAKEREKARVAGEANPSSSSTLSSSSRPFFREDGEVGMEWMATTAASAVHSAQLFPLGQHDGGGAAGAVLSALASPPPALTLSAMKAAGAACAAYPNLWYSVALPPWFAVTPAGGASTFRVYGSLAQKTVKGVSSVCASPAGEPLQLNFAVLEAQVVITGALPKDPAKHPHPYLKRTNLPTIYF